MQKTLLIFLAFFLVFNGNALDIHMIKAPTDGPEEMKKYTIVRSVNDDGYVIAGSTFSIHFGAMAVNVMLVDDAGAVQWRYYYGFPGQGFEATHIDYNTTNDGYIICGYTMRESPFSPRPFVLEIDGAGVQIRNRFLDVEGAFLKVKPTPKGFYIATGFVGDTSLYSPKEAIAVKLDILLTPHWMHTYQGDYNLSSSPFHHEGVYAVYVDYDGTNETYILGGNFTGPIGTAPYYVPIIDIRELNENGIVINQLSNKAYIPPSPPSGIIPYDIILQDLVVVKDEESEYYGDIIMIGKQFTFHNYDPTWGSCCDGDFLTITRYKRNPIIRDSEFRVMESLPCATWMHHFLRGNKLTYLNGKVYLAGTIEDDIYNSQIPIIVEIDPSLPDNTGISACTPNDYPCIFFRDASTLSFAKYYGNELVFSDYLGTSFISPAYGPTWRDQIVGHDLGYFDIDAINQMRYGLVGTRKQYLNSTTYSLFLVSNINNDFCYKEESYITHKLNYSDIVDTFKVKNQLVSIPNRILTIFDVQAHIHEDVCASNGLIWSSEENSKLKEETISLYPNPVNQHLNINGLDGNEDILILDLNGRIVAKFESKANETQINLENLNSGIYLVKIFNSDKIVFITKISKI